MLADDIVKEAMRLNDECKHYDDLVGIAQRAFPELPSEEGAAEVAKKIAERRHFLRQFISDALPGAYSPQDYLDAMKAWTEFVASGISGRNNEERWYAAQDEIAKHLLDGDSPSLQRVRKPELVLQL